jgi:hypothetical protein
LASAVALAPLAMAAPASSRELTPIPVKTADPIVEWSPAADRAWFGWTRADRPSDSGNYFVQRGTEPRFRVNPKGTSADGGGIYRRTLVYAQWGGDRPSDLYRFDLRTGRRTALPDRVNTRRASERSPTLSGRYLLFDRLRRTGPQFDPTIINKVLLYDRTTRRLRVLARYNFFWDSSCLPYVQAQQVNGAYVVWEDGYNCGRPVAHVVLYNIRRDTKVQFPRPRNQSISQQSAAVSSSGTVYFVRQNISDNSQRIVKKPLGGQPEVVYPVPSDQYVSDLYVDDRATAGHVYFAVSDGDSDIYKLINPVPAP